MKFTPSILSTFIATAATSSYLAAVEARSLRGSYSNMPSESSYPSAAPSMSDATVDNDQTLLSMDAVHNLVASFEISNPGNSSGDRNLLQSGGASEATFPINGDSDQLLQGFAIGAQGTGISPFENIQQCETSVDGRLTDTKACWTNGPENSPSDYNGVKIHDSKSTSDFISSSTTVEGGSIGFHASVSAEYMHSSDMNTDSVSYLIGGTIHHHKKRVHNGSELKLKQTAKQLLQTQPDRFLSMFGLNYVHSVGYGGTFLGSYTLNSKNSQSQQSVSAAADIHYDEGIYSVDGSANFTNNMSKEHNHIEEYKSFHALPEPAGLRKSINQPSDLADIYHNWSNSTTQNPSPIYLIAHTYLISKDFQDIWFNLPANYKAAFQQSGLSPDTIETASKERVETGLLLKALTRYLSWPRVQQNSELHKTLKDLHLDTQSYYNIYTSDFSDASAYQLQDQIQDESPTVNGTSNKFNSWKYYSQDGGLSDQFHAIKPEIQNLNPACDLANTKVLYLGNDKKVYQDPTNCSNDGGECDRYDFVPSAAGDTCDMQPNQNVFYGWSKESNVPGSKVDMYQSQQDCKSVTEAVGSRLLVDIIGKLLCHDTYVYKFIPTRSLK